MKFKNKPKEMTLMMVMSIRLILPARSELHCANHLVCIVPTSTKISKPSQCTCSIRIEEQGFVRVKADIGLGIFALVLQQLRTVHLPSQSSCSKASRHSVVPVLEPHHSSL